MSFTLQSKIPKISKELHQKASRLVRQTAFKIERRAKVAAPVDYGFLRNSIYAATPTKSDYDPSIEKAKNSLKKKKKGKKPPTERSVHEQDTPSHSLAAVVSVAAEYAPHVEFGTHKMAARPFFGPAFEETRPEFEAGLKELLKI